MGPLSERDVSGKENKSKTAAAARSARRASVFQDSDMNKGAQATAKSKQQKQQQQPPPGTESVEMEDAFDKLLVIPIYFSSRDK